MSLQLLNDLRKKRFDLPMQNQCYKRKVTLHTEAKDSKPDANLLEDLISWLHDQDDSSRRITVEMTCINSPDDGFPTTEFVLTSGVLGQLQKLMSVNEDLGLLRLTLNVLVYGDPGNAKVASLVLTDFTPHPSDKKAELCSKYVCRDSTFQNLDVDLDPAQFYYAEMQLTVDTSSYIGLSDLLSPCDPMIQAIFKERKYCDFELVSKDGSGIPCHKDFLRIQSSVLKATIDGEFVEGQRGKLVMQDATDATVYAFLKFIYCKTVKKACRFCNVAFELLKAADYYDMELLWKVMVRILKEKPLEWYQVEVGLELFEFAVKKVSRDGISDLKEKALKVLARNIRALDESALFLEMFPTTPSREMFKSMLEREAFRATA